MSLCSWRWSCILKEHKRSNGINTTETNRRAPERPRRNERPHVHKWVICISGCDVCLMPPGFVGQSRCYVRWTNLFTDFHNFIHPLAGSQTRRKSWPVMTCWGPASTQTCSLLLSNNYSDVVMAAVARWRSLTRMCQRSLDLHISGFTVAPTHPHFTSLGEQIPLISRRRTEDSAACLLQIKEFSPSQNSDFTDMQHLMWDIYN